MMQYLSCAQRSRNPDNPNERSRSHGLYRQRIEVNIEGMSNTITTVQKDYLLMEENENKGKLITKEIAEQLKLPEEYIGKRFRIRKLTPTECFRLMGVDDDSIRKLTETKNEKGGSLYPTRSFTKWQATALSSMSWCICSETFSLAHLTKTSGHRYN